MTTFVVSLFLPYTIEFDASSSSNRSPVTPPVLPRTPSTFNATQLSLLIGQSSPQIAVHDVDVDPFLSRRGSAASITSVHGRDPGTYVSTEPQVSEWGRVRIFNQPLSKASTAPPSTILLYAKAQEFHASRQLEKLRDIQTPRRLSRERRFSESGWAVRPAIQTDGGLANAVKAAMKESVDEHMLWVGTIGFPTDALADSKKQEIDDQLENEHDALTVFVDDSDFDGHYSHYCKTILWPFLHYQIPDHPKSKAYQDHSWVYYVKVNEAFAERVVRSYKHGDTIWIHDYHLLLVPGMIRKKLPDARIGFFLHTAFPSSEVFRCLPVRKQLLEGMLGANLIAFQAQEYAHHFLTTCGRLLVVEATEHGVQLEDHFVNVTSVPIGIVPDYLMSARKEPEVTEWVKALTAKYKDKHLIVARDKLDSISGIRQKLLAYEMFLKGNPQWKEKAVLLQVATSSGGGDNKDLESAVADIVTRIDAQYSSLAHQPLVFLKKDISFSQYIALLTAADVLMVTPLRDGMNLTGHDYVLCQDGSTNQSMGISKKNGPLILSESTGSAQVFGGAELSVNPWDYLQCARAIKRALEMSEVEKAKRYDSLLTVVLKNNGIYWVHELNRRLFKAYDEHQIRDTMSVPRLNIKTLSEQYRESSSRLFILDYEGTLASWESPERSTLSDPQRVVDTVISLLSASDANIVYVASGQTPTDLEHSFRALPNVGLIAENGGFVRPFTQEFSAREWIDLADCGKSSKWKEGVLSILKYYSERIEGSWIEERHHSVIFHYDGVKGESDMESAARQAGECANHINDSCRTLRVRAVPVDKAVVIEPIDHSKMTASAYLLELERVRIGATMINGRTTKLATTNGLSSPSRLARANGMRSPINGVRSPRRTSVARDLVRARSSSGVPDSPKCYSPTYPTDSAIDGMSYFSPKHDRDLQGYPDPPPSVPSSTVPDFLMVAGDNREDEPVFRWANQLASEGVVRNVVSVCVGKRTTTEAGCTLTQGVNGLLTALGKLAML